MATNKDGSDRRIPRRVVPWFRERLKQIAVDHFVKTNGWPSANAVRVEFTKEALAEGGNEEAIQSGMVSKSYVGKLINEMKRATPLTQLGLSSRVLRCLGQEGIIYDNLPGWMIETRRPKTLRTVEDILEFTRLLTLMRQRRNLLVNRNDSQMRALHYIRGFGRKRREELENKLYEYGFIDSPDTKVPRPTTWTNMEADSDRVNILFNAYELHYMDMESPYDFADPSNERRSHTP